MKTIENLKSWFKYNLEFIKIFNSPFKKPKLYFYFGDISIGLPYFLPRKWVYLSKSEALKEASEEYNKLNDEQRTKLTFSKILERKLKCRKCVELKFGFDYCTLGWKTKWDEYRFEWEPRLSFVAFKKQIVIGFQSPMDFKDVYWEAWLYYNNCTEGTKDQRFTKLINNHCCKWISYKNGTEETIDYYTKILNKKYLKKYMDK